MTKRDFVVFVVILVLVCLAVFAVTSSADVGIEKKVEEHLLEAVKANGKVFAELKTDLIVIKKVASARSISVKPREMEEEKIEMEKKAVMVVVERNLHPIDYVSVYVFSNTLTGTALKTEQIPLFEPKEGHLYLDTLEGLIEKMALALERALRVTKDEDAQFPEMEMRKFKHTE